MKIETDSKIILEERKRVEGPLCDRLTGYIQDMLEPILEKAYLKGYADAILQIGYEIQGEMEE